jgi:hypothetical protein
MMKASIAFAVIALLGHLRARIEDRRRAKRGLPAWRPASLFRPVRRFKQKIRMVGGRHKRRYNKKTGDFYAWEQKNYIRLYPNPGWQLGAKHKCWRTHCRHAMRKRGL